MVNFRPYDRGQQLLLPPDLREWVPEDDLAHFIIEAVERVGLSAFKVNWAGTGKAQYHPRLMPALLIYSYANGIFSSRRIERATHRDVAVRFVAADQHPDHDTIATFRRENTEAIAAAFAEVLLVAREVGLLQLGLVSIDGSKIDANASKVRSVRYDRADELLGQLEADIAALLAKADAADAEDAPDPQALPEEIARRQALKAKLDAACARLEADAQARAEEERAEYDEKKRKHEARHGQGRPPREPDDTPPPDAQSNLTDPDSALMRKSKRHEYRQAYNAQAVVDADGSQLVLGADVSQSASDAPSFEAIIDRLCQEVGHPLPSQRHRKRQSRMAARHAGLQLQAPGQPPGRMSRRAGPCPHPPSIKPDRLLAVTKIIRLCWKVRLLGLGLRDVGALVAIAEEEGCPGDRTEYREILGRHLASVNERIERLSRLRDTLENLMTRKRNPANGACCWEICGCVAATDRNAQRNASRAPGPPSRKGGRHVRERGALIRKGALR